MEDNNEKIRVLVCQRIEEVQDAMKSLQNVRKTLVHKAYEVGILAGLSYLCKFSSATCNIVGQIWNYYRLTRSLACSNIFTTTVWHSNWD